MNFSTNQTRHLYVAKEFKTPNVLETDKAGAITVKSDKDKKHLYFQFMSPGGLVRSDLIDIENILSIKATAAAAMEYPLTKYKVTLDSTVNEGNPIAGQDYLLRIAFSNYIGMSEEDQYFKYGMVHAVAKMTASDFYKTLALSLVKNFSREESNILKFYLETGGTDPAVGGTLAEVDASTKEASLSGTYTGIVIEEMEQGWELGTFEQTPLNFILQPDLVVDEGDERIWGIVNKLASTTKLNNGKKIADLEYFCMGERGDQYRMVGWPNVIKTTYLVDPEKAYNTIDIHYAYVGSNESCQKSEKDITIVADSTATINSIIEVINAATGLSIETL